MPTITANYAPEDCNWCGCLGKDPNNESNYCPICYGQGSVLVVQPARRCVTCYGTGRDNSDSTRYCRPCGGSGWAHRHIRSS